MNTLTTNQWIVDRTPYHLTHPSPVDTGEQWNSLSNNTHTFNICKYYKQNFQNIPRLQKYDVIVWLDGTVQITHPQTAEWILYQIQKHPLITWEHKLRQGRLFNEVSACAPNPNGPDANERYSCTFWFGQPQPYQDIAKQYQCYLEDGYDDQTYWSNIDPLRPNFGVWCTLFIAFDNHHPLISKFLNLWYQQTLEHTTQDQVGFPYAAQKLNMIPYTLPDQTIRGDYDYNSLFIKRLHAQ